MRVAFCYIQGFGRHPMWRNLLQPQQRNTSTEGKNSPFLDTLPEPHHLILRNGCCFWAECGELSRLLTYLTSGIQIITDILSWEGPTRIMKFNSWMNGTYGDGAHTLTSTTLTNMIASAKSLSPPRRQSPSPASAPSLLTRPFLTAELKPGSRLCPGSWWTLQPWVHTRCCWLFWSPLLYSWTS